MFNLPLLRKRLIKSIVSKIVVVRIGFFVNRSSVVIGMSGIVKSHVSVSGRVLRNTTILETIISINLLRRSEISPKLCLLVY